jgi:putative iron-dependent peroxidase
MDKGGMSMRVAQSGIFALGTGSHSYLEFDLLKSADPLAMVKAIANLREPRTTTGGVNLVAGFRPSLWERIAPQDMPAGVTDFDQAVQGVDGYAMPATQHDLWLWVAGHAYDKVFDVTREAMSVLTPVAILVSEVAGWTYKENRDLTGFIDGTENPSLSDAPEVALIPPQSRGAGGSIVLVQKWMHDAFAFDALPIEEQEKVIGRTKDTSVELDEEVRGAQSHVSRTVIEEHGVEQHIFRRNTPFGTATEHGTMFIGFSRDQHRLARMLARMAGAEDGIRDALTRYTTAVSGAYYLVPSVESLRSFAAEDD